MENKLEAFWVHAINAARLDPDTAFSGQKELTALCPVAFAGGDTEAEADAFLEAVVSGKKKVFCSYIPSYEMEGVPYPERGDMAILCDGRGNPRALLVNECSEKIPFQEITEEIARAAGEESLASWQEKYRKIFRAECERQGREFSEKDSVLIEHIKAIYVA